MKMRSLPTLPAIALLSACTIACGEARKSAGPAREPHFSGAMRTDRITGAGPKVGASVGGRSASHNPSTSVHRRAFGHESARADRREIVAVVRRYYSVAAAGDGAQACSLMYSIFARAVPDDYGQPPGPASLRGKTCAVVMSKLFKQSHRRVAADASTLKVTGVGIMGEEAIVSLSSRTMPPGEIFVHREGRGWKVMSLLAKPLSAPGEVE